MLQHLGNFKVRTVIFALEQIVAGTLLVSFLNFVQVSIKEVSQVARVKSLPVIVDCFLQKLRHLFAILKQTSIVQSQIDSWIQTFRTGESNFLLPWQFFGG